jgi:2-oxoglutarate ferredoxin oxidoreductase subunit alpha
MPSVAPPSTPAQDSAAPLRVPVETVELAEHVLEIVSDAGEGAQTAGNLFAQVMARAGAGVWTVEIIPAEIEPPQRSRAGGSGNRIRFAPGPVTNMGDRADVVVAFNEQVLYGRMDQDAFRPGTLLLIDGKWGTDPDPEIRRLYAEAIAEFKAFGMDVREVPIEEETLKVTSNPRRGKNMWVVGLLASLYSLSLDPFVDAVAGIFIKKRKSQKVVDSACNQLRAGYLWAEANLPVRFHLDLKEREETRVVMNGNTALALGCMAAGIELCSMYPITPATSASHSLAALFDQAGGFVHQAEDEIAAIGFAIGASYAGKTAVTITSGPGMALKTEMIGLAVMAEVPLVIIDVQRGGPSTGLPTKVEQGDLLHAILGHPGDAPKIVLAPADIEECFHMVVTARQLAETFRGPVIVLSDANLATGQAPFPYPEPKEEWLSAPVDQQRWRTDRPAYDWDPETGLSTRPIPGQPGGNYVLTGLAHDERSKVAYESAINQKTMAMRSQKLHTLQRSLKPPEVFGPETGDLLVVGWGSTKGAIEEAVERVRKKGHKVATVHLRFLSPMEPGLTEIFARYDRVMTVEINYSDDVDAPGIHGENRRYSQLALLLRAQTLVDVDCWSRVPGQPLPPWMIEEALLQRLEGTR